MNEILIYSLKSAMVLAMLFIPYILMLRKESFFRLNRMILLTILVLSVILPACNLSMLAVDDNPIAMSGQLKVSAVAMASGNATVSPSDNSWNIDWMSISGIALVIGMLIATAVRLVQIALINRSIRRGCLWQTTEDGCSIYCHAGNIAPFSWMNSIVINEKDYKENGRQIILHEKGHVMHHHSFDMLLLTVVEILQWWNPFVYLLATSLSDVHEYEADDHVLSTGVNIQEYQILLIRKAIGSGTYAFANNFKHSLIKNRISMMMKSKSSKWAYGKALYFLPVVLVALVAFARPNSEAVSQKKKTVKTAVKAPAKAAKTTVSPSTTDPFASIDWCYKNEYLTAQSEAELQRHLEEIYQSYVKLPDAGPTTNDLALYSKDFKHCVHYTKKNGKWIKVSTDDRTTIPKHAAKVMMEIEKPKVKK